MVAGVCCDGEILLRSIIIARHFSKILRSFLIIEAILAIFAVFHPQFWLILPALKRTIGGFREFAAHFCLTVVENPDFSSQSWNLPN